MPLIALLVLAVAAGATTYRVLHAGSRTASRVPTVGVGRGDVVVTVGGVGHVVTAGSTSLGAGTAVSAGGVGGAGSSQSGAGGGTPLPAGAVTPRVSGRVARVLVRPGAEVVAGEPLAVVDDAGAAATALHQATNEVAAATVELDRAQHPLSPAEAAALAAEVRRTQADLETLGGGTARDRADALRRARESVTVASAKLRLVQHPRTAADIAAARAEVARAEAELAALLAPPAPPTAESVAAARAALTAAEARLRRLTGPPDPLAVTAARAEVTKAQADLAVLLTQSPPAPQVELDAARAAVDTATARLAQLLGPPDPADVATAQAEVSRAQADVAALLTPPAAASATAVAAARQNLQAARTKLAVLSLPVPAADVTAARADLDRAVGDLRLLRAGPRPAALAAARAAVDSARVRAAGPANHIDVDAARVRLSMAGTAVTAARQALDLLMVRAVSGGTVTGVLARHGAPIDPTVAIVTVNDLHALAVDVDVSEFDAARVRSGAQVVLAVDALGGKSFAGRVLAVAAAGTVTGGVVTYPVRVSIAPGAAVRPGMNVSVRIVVDERRHVLLVPLSVLRSRTPTRAVVRVLDPAGHPQRRTVQLGLADNANAEVVDGLRVGDRVVAPAAGSTGG